MKILVCGGAGYIGSHTVAELLDQGFEVIVVDNLSKGHKKSVLPNAKLYIGDLKDSVFLNRVFQENKIDAVINFAAFSLVGESMTEPCKYFENNVGGTLNLLKAMKENDCKKIVFSSTAATYGEPENVPIMETDKTFPTNPYGESKLMVEKILKWFDEAYGIKYVVLRYFNVAGAHKSGTIGEDHFPETHLIPIVLQAGIGVRDKIEVFGTDYDTKDGTCIRDYIHVTDLADAHILSVLKLVKDNTSTTYNLGSGSGFSVQEIIDTAEKVIGKKINTVYGNRRLGDPSSLIASSKKIIEELNWTPKYNTLEQIIQSAYTWHENNPNGYNDK